MYIRGTIASSGKSFAIQGEAQNSGSNDMILFNGVDKNQNYEVVHMAYSNLVKNTSLYHDTLKRTMPNASVLKIYLKEPNKNALTIHVDFDTSISIYGPVSLGLTYTKSDPNAKKSLDFFDLSGMPRAALSSLESDKRLEAKGQKYSTWWRIAKQDSTRRTNSFQVRFYYDISSLYDYTWGGPKTFTKSYSYVSNN